MQVKDILKIKGSNVFTISPESKVLDAMKLLIQNKISCLPVMSDNDGLVGIISDKDIFKTVYEKQTDFTGETINELMTTDLIVGVESDDLEYITGLMTKNRVRHIPIVDKENLVGLISIGDIVKARQEDIEIENRYLKQYIDGSYPG